MNRALKKNCPSGWRKLIIKTKVIRLLKNRLIGKIWNGDCPRRCENSFDINRASTTETQLSRHLQIYRSRCRAMERLLGMRVSRMPARREIPRGSRRRASRGVSPFAFHPEKSNCRRDTAHTCRPVSSSSHESMKKKKGFGVCVCCHQPHFFGPFS